MTVSDPSHDPVHDSAPPAGDLFPEREWREFRESDKEAGKRIVILMTGIFIVGIVLYSVVVATM